MSSYNDNGFTPDETDFAEADRAPMGDFELMPPGEYRVVLSEASWADTARGGVMLKMTMDVQGGQYQGRKVWDNLQRSCPGSPKAEQIGRGQITRLCRALGKPNGFRDPGELLGRPFAVKLKLEPGSSGYGPKNRLASIMVPDDGAPAAPAAPPPRRAAGPPRVADVSKEDVPW